MTTGAVILWFLMATTGPRMDEGGPIAYPHSLAHFHTKTECEKKALNIVKENTLPGRRHNGDPSLQGSADGCSLWSRSGCVTFLPDASSRPVRCLITPGATGISFAPT
jgi:hypothetical protein